MKAKFTKPKVCKSKAGWYVHFRYNQKQKRYKLGLNRIKNIGERTKEANYLADALHSKLKSGWCPFTDALNVDVSLQDALDFALSKKVIAKKTYSGYKGSLKFFNQSAEQLNFNFLPIHKIKRSHIRLIIDKCKVNRNWSNKARNKHLNHMKALFSELVEWDIIEHSPAHKIKSLSVEESRANTPATSKEQQIIKEHLKNNYPNFYKFVLFIYHTGIRPKELLLIKLYMIDLKSQVFILPPSITKTNKERIVPINNHLVTLLKDINNYSNNYYLFGSHRLNGRGNIGKHTDFIIAPTAIKRDTATKRWKKIVKDGLKINVNLYSNKHAGANAKIRAGIDLDALRELYGHKSKMMTVRYAKAIKEYYRNEIIQKSPEF